MKYLSILLIFFACTVQGQTVLKFDKRFVESEDKWVAFQKDKYNAYSYGFIYIDPQAGLTFNQEGNFIISGNGTLFPRI